MRGWEADVWTQAEQEAWNLSALRYRHDRRIGHMTAIERDLREVIALLAELMGYPR